PSTGLAPIRRHWSLENPSPGTPEQPVRAGLTTSLGCVGGARLACPRDRLGRTRARAPLAPAARATHRSPYRPTKLAWGTSRPTRPNRAQALLTDSRLRAAWPARSMALLWLRLQRPTPLATPRTTRVPARLVAAIPDPRLCPYNSGMSNRFRVVVTDFIAGDLGPERQILSEVADLVALDAYSEDDLRGRVEDADALMLYHNVEIRQPTIERLSRCKLIVRCGVGY